MKKQRHNKILEIINSRPIDTQEDLQRELINAGFDVSQASISRDIKEMRIVKVLDSNGVYRYAVTSQNRNRQLKNNDIFTHSVISVSYSMNDVVIKCHSGLAQGACAALDTMDCENVLGTLAGDDTIFVITKSEKDAENLYNYLSEIIK